VSRVANVRNGTPWQQAWLYAAARNDIVPMNRAA
jgi:hypothetical protein